MLKMKVVLAVYRDDERAGGSIRVAETLARALKDASVDIHAVVAYGPAGRLKRILGRKCHLVSSSGPRDLKAWLRYRRLLKKLRPDVVHYVDNVGWMTFSGARLAKARVTHQHFRPNVGPGASRRFARTRWLTGTADRVIAISEGAAKSLVEDCRVNPCKVSVVHNGIDEWALSRIVRPQTDRRCTVLGMAARIVEDKGLEDALSLMAVLPSEFQLVIAGDGPARPRFEKRVAEMGLQDRVEWKGSLVDIAQFFASIDLYLFLSWYEGFGLSVAESMACGVPVVGLLGDGEIGEEAYPLVTPANSVLVKRSVPHAFRPEQSPEVISELAREVIALAEDLPRRQQIASEAESWVRSKFSSKLHAERMLEAYRLALRGAGPVDEK